MVLLFRLVSSPRPAGFLWCSQDVDTKGSNLGALPIPLLGEYGFALGLDLEGASGPEGGKCCAAGFKRRRDQRGRMWFSGSGPLWEEVGGRSEHHHPHVTSSIVN